MYVPQISLEKNDAFHSWAFWDCWIAEWMRVWPWCMLFSSIEFCYYYEKNYASKQAKNWSKLASNLVPLVGRVLSPFDCQSAWSICHHSFLSIPNSHMQSSILFFIHFPFLSCSHALQACFYARISIVYLIFSTFYNINCMHN